MNSICPAAQYVPFLAPRGPLISQTGVQRERWCLGQCRMVDDESTVLDANVLVLVTRRARGGGQGA